MLDFANEPECFLLTRLNFRKTPLRNICFLRVSLYKILQQGFSPVILLTGASEAFWGNEIPDNVETAYRGVKNCKNYCIENNLISKQPE